MKTKSRFGIFAVALVIGVVAVTAPNVATVQRTVEGIGVQFKLMELRSQPAR